MNTLTKTTTNQITDKIKNEVRSIAENHVNSLTDLEKKISELKEKNAKLISDYEAFRKEISSLEEEIEKEKEKTKKEISKKVFSLKEADKFVDLKLSYDNFTVSITKQKIYEIENNKDLLREIAKLSDEDISSMITYKKSSLNKYLDSLSDRLVKKFCVVNYEDTVTIRRKNKKGEEK